MAIYYSPNGNPEVWNDRPAGYFTPEEWQAAHPVPQPEQPGLEDIRAVTVAAVNAGFDAAIAASLTMPSRNTPPSAIEVALAIEDFKIDDPEGWATVRAVHEARRDELLAVLAAATSVEAVQAVAVSYAV